MNTFEESMDWVDYMKGCGSGGPEGVVGKAAVCCTYGIEEGELFELINKGVIPVNNYVSPTGILGWTIDSIKKHLEASK